MSETPKPTAPDIVRTRPTPETDDFILVMVRTDHNWRKFARGLERQRDEAREQVAAMREAAAIVQTLAEWSERYPRSRIYLAGNHQMDDELIQIEEQAKAALAKLQPFLKS